MAKNVTWWDLWLDSNSPTLSSQSDTLTTTPRVFADSKWLSDYYFNLGWNIVVCYLGGKSDKDP